MTVTAAAGFDAAGIAAGIKRSGALDLAVVVNRGPSQAAAAVFTSNRAKANPILWSEQVIVDGNVAAIVLNSGGANCFTGPEGFQVTHRTAEATAAALAVAAGDVLVCSTGLIGDQLDVEVLEEGVLSAVNRLASDGVAGDDAARAIMTTDTKPKTVVVERGRWRIGGMAKGAGMLAPGLATMLVVLTTDADLPAADLDAALRAATRVTFDRLDSDGCMSTNDQVSLLASGASGVAPALDVFTDALTEACRDLARATAGRRRRRQPRHHDRGPWCRHRRRRRRGRAFGRAQQPVQGRDLRQRPQLGTRARRHRHHEGTVRPLPRRRFDERGAGLPRGPARRPAR